MKKEKYNYFVCPGCGGAFDLTISEVAPDDNVAAGSLACIACKEVYPIIKSIPRFVSRKNYAVSFGYQWSIHARTQLDKFNGTTISRDRFYGQTEWPPADLQGKTVLECGSGAGRFTQVALDAGALCFTLDYSSAVEVNLENNGPHDNLVIAQADICRIPFKKKSFDYIFCFGVLQHTPDVKKSFLSMAPYLKAGGEIVVDVYDRNWRALVHPKYLLRPFTCGINKKTLYGIVSFLAPFLLKLSIVSRKIPVFGKYISNFIPIANYQGILPLSDKALLEWAILDTFDWLSPAYDQPQSAETLRQLFVAADLKDITIKDMGSLVGKGRA